MDDICVALQSLLKERENQERLTANMGNHNTPHQSKDVNNPSQGDTISQIIYLPNCAPLPNSKPQDTQSMERFQNLEERLRIIEGSDSYRLNSFNLCLVDDVMVPTKFKMPNFEKYNV